MILNACGKLITHLCGHERVGDIVLFEIVVQSHEVETQFLGDDIDGSAASQCRIHIHHTCIETIAGVCRHPVLWFQLIKTLIPMTEGYKIAVSNLAALWHPGRAGCVEEDK